VRGPIAVAVLGDLLPPELLARIARGVRLVERARRIRILGHYDPDGTTSAAILVRAMLRWGKDVHASTSNVIDEAIAARIKEEGNELVIVADMGSGQLDRLESLACPVIVLDHHTPPRDSEAVVHVNPHLVGVDGAREACGSTTTWTFTLAMDERNWDLAGVAAAGAIGDMQHVGGFTGLNAKLFDEAVARKALSRERGLALRGSSVADALSGTLPPYVVGVTGHRESAAERLRGLGIDPDVPLSDLTADERRTLTSHLVTMLLRQGAEAETVESIVADKLWSPTDGVYAHELADYVNGCSRLGFEGLGLSLCLGDKDAFARAEDIRQSFHTQMMAYLHVLESEGPTAKEHIQVVYTNEATLAGTVAQIGMNYFLDPSKPTLGLSRMDRSTKVSARATKRLVAKGVDLAAALQEGAKAVGGTGGGHNIASGATVPRGSEEVFLAAVDGIVARQLAPTAA